MLDKSKLKGKRNSPRGVTLVELLITVAILAIVLVGLLRLFIYCFNLNEISGNLTMAVSEAQGKLEEIRNHNLVYNLGSVVSTYDDTTFNLTQLSGTGTIYIDDSNSELVEIEIVLSWQTKGNRIIETSLVSLAAKR